MGLGRWTGASVSDVSGERVRSAHTVIATHAIPHSRNRCDFDNLLLSQASAGTPNPSIARRRPYVREESRPCPNV